MSKDLEIMEQMMKAIAKSNPESLSGYYDEDGYWHQTVFITLSVINRGEKE